MIGDRLGLTFGRTTATRAPGRTAHAMGKALPDRLGKTRFAGFFFDPTCLDSDLSGLTGGQTCKIAFLDEPLLHDSKRCENGLDLVVGPAGLFATEEIRDCSRGVPHFRTFGNGPHRLE